MNEPKLEAPTPTAAAALQRYTEHESARQFTAPPDFAERVANHALAERFCRRVLWYSALAASLLVLGSVTAFVLWPKPTETHEVLPIVVHVPVEPTLSESLSDAGDSVAELTRHTTDRAVGPTRNLLANLEKVSIPSQSSVGLKVEPTVQVFAALPGAAKASFQPLASGPRRAITLFLRDTGLHSN